MFVERWNGASSNAKVFCLGEIHGVKESSQYQLEFIKFYLKKNCSISILLERDYDQQSEIDEWLYLKMPSSTLSNKFINPTTSSFLENQYNFLRELVQLNEIYPKKIKIYCVDISFTEKGGDSERIRNMDDENNFDYGREEFIKIKLSEIREKMDKSDRVFWITGNMHASKRPYYFSLEEDYCKHIETSTMWLQENYLVESVYFLPFQGEYSYQNQSKIVNCNIKINCNTFKNIKNHPFNGLCKTENMDLPLVFKESYDWIMGVEVCTPSYLRP